MLLARIRKGRLEFENLIAALDWLGIRVFSLTSALVASRNQMDMVGFILLGTK
ncbi:TRIC cation channel family protein [Aquidulcibacter paucihalophilus]|uniref:TRIC cation channel family protein n=1 Tax=Aquidulcibacter paucihalophilus TaxID=1978549 RepID=UPI0012FF8256